MKIFRLFVAFTLICFALSQSAQGVVPPPPGGYPNFTTAAGEHALQALTLGLGNTALGTFSLFSVTTGNFNTAVGAGSLDLNTADNNTATGAAALLLNTTGGQNTATGTAALAFNDSSGLGLGNNNTAVGASTLFNNVDGSENTVVGTGSGNNLVAGFNNNYLGNFIGTCVDIGCSGPVPDESSTIRIGDLSENGFGSAACFIGGIFNNFQPVGGSVVEVTLDLNTDELGWDVGPNQSAPSVPSRSGAPVRRGAPQPAARPQRTALSQPAAVQALQHQARLGDKVEKLQATVAQQQKQIETLTAQLKEQAETFTAQLKEQATQIQKVSAELEATKPSPQVVNNP
jgi:hypothetical protein